jgi:membrane fusion protein (multidrug efflux system)
MNDLRCIVLLIFIPAFFSCSQQKDKIKERPPVVVDVILAEKVNFSTSVEVNGAALSEERIEISGRLTYLNIPDGASVTKGTILARINDAELQAQLEQIKVQLALAGKTEQRLKKLLEVNGVNQSEYDVALSQVNSLNASSNVLNAQIDKTVVRAAFDGKLGLRMVSPGAFVSPQTLLGTLQQMDKIKIDFAVPETYADLISVGGKVGIQTNSSEETLSAIISAIEPLINPDTRNLKVRARLESGRVSPGAFIKVLLIENKNVIVVPSNAIIPDASSNQVVVVKNNKATFVNVETGVRNADVVELLSGVSTGDSIVVSGVLFVRPNAAVKVRSIKTLNTGNIQNSKDSVK